MSRNAEIAAKLDEIADYYEALGDDYRPQTYRRAANSVRDHPDAVEDLAKEGLDAVTELDAVGESIGEKIVEYVETGSIAKLDELREDLPVNMAELERVEGVGPKRIKTLYDALNITTLDELEAAAENGEIRAVEGFGEKSEQNILDHIAFARSVQDRERLGDGRPVAEDVRDTVLGFDAVDRAEVAGSTRRWRETIGDVDVLLSSDDGLAVADALADWERVDEVIESGETKTSVRIAGLRVDVRVVVDAEFGAALQYFTGSKDHNITLRNYAIDQGKKVNEYGVFDIRRSDAPASQSEADASDDVSTVEDPDSGQRVGERLASETEADVYGALGLPLIPPELREDRGEVQAAIDDALPALVSEDDIRGDLHTHTDWSDGANTLAEMLDAAENEGFDYYAVTDHGVGPGIVGGTGLDDDDLREQFDVVREAAADYDLEVFTGVEANVAADGTVGDVSDDVLADADLVVASPHSGLGDDGGDQTDRLVSAVEHPSVDILGHPSGRLINDRPAMAFDASELAAAAADAGTALEVNANPARLDLWGSAVQAAVEAGATIAIDTDAHSPGEFANATYGAHTAMRGWAEPADVLNTWDVDDVRDFLH